MSRSQVYYEQSEIVAEEKDDVFAAGGWAYAEASAEPSDAKPN